MIYRLIKYIFLFYLFKSVSNVNINDFFDKNMISYKELSEMKNITKIEILKNDRAYIFTEDKDNLIKFKYLIGDNLLFNNFINSKVTKIDIEYIKNVDYFSYFLNGMFIVILFNLIKLFLFNETNFYKLVDSNVKLNDVIGLCEVKEEVQEFIDILKNKDEYNKMNCCTPRGILFYGESGTGKTLMAKAIANEAKIKMIYTNGSSFNEKYVGVGQARVKELFNKANSYEKCIIFIDEIDTLGRKRSDKGDHSEFDNTLNSLLAEMDGMNENKNILVIGATNRMNILDNALVRPGRFDRKIEFNLPNLDEREKVLVHYFRKHNISNDDALSFSKTIANKTFGFSFADMKNLCNESAIKAVTDKKDKIDISHIDKALEYILVGNKRLSSKLMDDDKEIVCYHEIGHALLSFIQKNTESPSKISIIPTTKGALGFSMSPSSEKKLISKNELLQKMAVLIAGRCSEQIFVNEVSTGAYDDLEKIKSLQKNFIKKYGFGDNFRNMNMDDDISEYCKNEIDKELVYLNNKIISYVNGILNGYKKDVKKVYDKLIEKEEIDGNELREILGSDKENMICFDLNCKSSEYDNSR